MNYDHHRYKGRPAQQRTEVEERCYDFLDGLQVPFDRVAHQRKKREEKRVNTQASKRTRQRLEKSLEPLKEAIKKPSQINRYVEVTFMIPMSIFVGNVEVVFQPDNEFMNVAIRRK